MERKVNIFFDHDGTAMHLFLPEEQDGLPPRFACGQLVPGWWKPSAKRMVQVGNVKFTCGNCEARRAAIAAFDCQGCGDEEERFEGDGEEVPF